MRDARIRPHNRTVTELRAQAPLTYVQARDLGSPGAMKSWLSSQFTLPERGIVGARLIARVAGAWAVRIGLAAKEYDYDRLRRTARERCRKPSTNNPSKKPALRQSHRRCCRPKSHRSRRGRRPGGSSQHRCADRHRKSIVGRRRAAAGPAASACWWPSLLLELIRRLVHVLHAFLSRFSVFRQDRLVWPLSHLIDQPARLEAYRRLESCHLSTSRR
jgi:hypothetical protein